MSRIPIPEDWTEEIDGWTQFVVCVPNSTQWRALFRGAVYNLTRGRKWDEDTGIIKDAQAVAWRIYDSMQNCTDNLKVTRMLVAAILGEQVDLTDPAQLTPDAVDYTAGGSLPGLVPTLAALNLSPVTEITNNVDCGGGCSCDGGGTEVPSEPGIEGGEPPEGYGPVTDDEDNPAPPGSEFYQSRKCKIANAIHESTLDIVVKLDENPILEFLDAIGVDPMKVLPILISTVMGNFVVPIYGAVAGAIAGFLLNLAIKLTLGEFDLAELREKMENNQTDAVCALYNSANGADAALAYINVLAADGLSLANQSLLAYFLTYDIINLMYYQKYPEVEAALETYVGPVDCSLCAVLQVVAVGNGQLGGAGHVGFPVEVGQTIVLNSVLDPDNGYYYAQVKPSTNSPCFAFTMRLISFVNPSYPTPTGDGRYLDDCSGNFDYYNDLTPLIGTTFSTSHFFAVSFDPGLQFEFELISIP